MEIWTCYIPGGDSELLLTWWRFGAVTYLVEIWSCNSPGGDLPVMMIVEGVNRSGGRLA